jgi:hypothetical protein
MDNLSSHTPKSASGKPTKPAVESAYVYYTSKHGSSLNQAEIAISLFSRQCLGRRRIADQACLRREARV